MCTYGNSVQELYDAINNCLDTIEGDFDRATLNQALDEVKKDYKYVSDSEEERGKAERATKHNNRQGDNAAHKKILKKRVTAPVRQRD